MRVIFQLPSCMAVGTWLPAIGRIEAGLCAWLADDPFRFKSLSFHLVHGIHIDSMLIGSSPEVNVVDVSYAFVWYLAVAAECWVKLTDHRTFLQPQELLWMYTSWTKKKKALPTGVEAPLGSCTGIIWCVLIVYDVLQIISFGSCNLRLCFGLQILINWLLD